MSKLCLTSAAVTASPFVNRAFGCNLKATALRSGATRIASASRPYIVAGSSPDITASGSNMKIIIPAGELPRVVNGLNLSKLLRRSGLRRYSVPPLGASGSTYSKCENPAGYLGSPKAA